MKSRHLAAALGACLIGLAGCAAPAATSSPTAAPTMALAQEQQREATAAPTADPAAPAVPAAPDNAGLDISSALGVVAEGALVPAQDASLLFGVQGTVGQVLVREGDVVQADQVLAVLKTDALDIQVSQAEAGLAGAQAQLAGIDEAPRTAALAAAQAQVRSAEAGLAQIKAGPKSQDVTSARAGLAAAQANLESQRINLSSAKARAESALTQAANNLRSAQDSYSQIYWKNRELEKLPGDLPQAVKDAETAALRAVENAQEGLNQAQIGADSARMAEQTSMQAAEQQVTQAQASLDKLLAGATSDQIAAAESGLAQARSQLDGLSNTATASRRAQLEAAVAQAQAALDAARYNRAQAELKAPFAGVVAEVNVDVGDPSSSAGGAAIRLIDPSELAAEVDVSDVDIARIQVGQTATLLIQSLPSTSFSGKVVYIAPVATVLGNVRTYTVRISIDDQSGLLSGMRARATIAPAP